MGKTTTAVNIAAALVSVGARVLVIDLDPQGNASTALGVPHNADTPSVYDVLIDEFPLADIVQVSPESPNLLCAPSTIHLAGAEIELVSQVAREHRFGVRCGITRDRGQSPRFRHHRLPSLAGTADDQRVHRGRRGHDPHPVRVLRARGAEPVARQCADDPEAPEPRSSRIDDPLDHVRRAYASRTAGRGGGSFALHGRGARHRHSSIRPCVRGAELRADRHRVRWPVSGRHRLPRGSSRDRRSRHHQEGS